MNPEQAEPLSAEPIGAEQRVALAYTPAQWRARLMTVFALDRRLGKIVAQASEPLLGQMRLAWWRDNLGKPVAERPAGDAVLDAIARHWGEDSANLARLTEGWEHLLGDAALTESDVREFVSGRVSALNAVFSPGEATADPLDAPGTMWALGDAAAHVRAPEDRALLLRLGLSLQPVALNRRRALRGIAVLDALAARALKNGGRALMEGRGAALLALKVGLLGR